MGKRLRGGAAEVQLGLWPGKQSCGCLLPQPTPQVCSWVLAPLRWPMAGTWLLLLLALGCPALPTGEPPPHIPLCASVSLPKPTPLPWVPWMCVACRDEGQRHLESPGEDLTRSYLSLPCYTPATLLRDPKSCSPGVHTVGRQGSHLLEVERNKSKQDGCPWVWGEWLGMCM